MKRWLASRYFVLAAVLSAGGFVLAWRLGDPSPWTTVVPVAIGGGWFHNAVQSWTGRSGPPDE